MAVLVGPETLGELLHTVIVGVPETGIRAPGDPAVACIAWKAKSTMGAIEIRIRSEGVRLLAQAWL